MSKKRKKKQKRKKGTGDTGKMLTKKQNKNKMKMLGKISGGLPNGENAKTHTQGVFLFT